MNKHLPPAVSGALIIGALCLLGALALLIFAPDFRGFFDRGHDTESLPVWVVALGMAGLNFVYAGFSYFIYRRTQQNPLSPPDQTNEQNRP
jgi:hypothetical protein